jgi:hypothetical protein
MDLPRGARACVAAVLALLAALAITACGGGSANSSAGTGTPTAAASRTTTARTPTTAGASRTTTPPSRSPESSSSVTAPDVIVAANGICRRLNSEIVRSDKGARGIARVVPLNEALETRALAELSRLQPAPSLARVWRKFLTLRAALAHELGALALAARRDRESTVEHLIFAKKRLHDEMGARATSIGLSECAKLG